MKKLLALLMAVALCMGLLAGVAMAEDENLASAKGLLDFMYKSKSRDKLTVTAEDYTVINQLMIDGVVYPVTWAVDLDTIQVQPAEDGKYTIVLDKANAKETTYTLTATVTAPDGSTLDVAYQRVMPAMLLEMSYADIVNAAYTLEDGAAMSKTQRLFGTVTAINTAWSDEYKNITVTIVCDGKTEQPVQCYRLSGEGADKLAVGDEIAVVGTIKNYKGTIEFDKGCKLIPVDSVASVKNVLAAYTLEEGAAMTEACTVTGVVVAIPTAWSDEYKNITVNMVVAGLEDYVLQCYRLSGEGADKLAEGDTITVTGTIKNYKGTVEFDKGCTLDAVAAK